MKKRYLIRAGYNPLKQYSAKDLQLHNLDIIGTNSGNMLFAYGVLNVLWTDDVDFDFIYQIKEKYDSYEIDHINSTYDALILPMADAFRPDYVDKLICWTNLIRKLKIPVIVIGIGYRGSYEPDLDEINVFDNSARDFVKTVLDHSSVLGLRGEITGNYLSRLGFKQDRHYMPIGCPSLYTYGLGIRKVAPPSSVCSLKTSRLCFSINSRGMHKYLGNKAQIIDEFINASVKLIPNHHLVQQSIYEFYHMYIGNYSRYAHYYVSNPLEQGLYEQLCLENRIHYFKDVPSWINFCEGCDFILGSRFHGSVAGVLAGLPHVLLPFNARVREMVDWHHLTHLSPGDIKVGTNILDYLDKLDFQSFHNYHKSNVENYKLFLSKNSLDSILSVKDSYKRGESTMEKKINMQRGDDILKPIESLPSWRKSLRTLSWNWNYLMNKWQQ